MLKWLRKTPLDPLKMDPMDVHWTLWKSLVHDHLSLNCNSTHNLTKLKVSIVQFYRAYFFKIKLKPFFGVQMNSNSTNSNQKDEASKIVKSDSLEMGTMGEVNFRGQTRRWWYRWLRSQDLPKSKCQIKKFYQKIQSLEHSKIRKISSKITKNSLTRYKISYCI